jgi:hypothetical protein
LTTLQGDDDFEAAFHFNEKPTLWKSLMQWKFRNDKNTSLLHWMGQMSMFIPKNDEKFCNLLLTVLLVSPKWQ